MSDAMWGRQKKKRLRLLQKRVKLLDEEICNKQVELQSLIDECAGLSTDIQIAEWPEWKQMALRQVFS